MIPLASINGHQWLVEEKKKIPLPDYMLRRFPPHRRQELQAVSSDSESSDSDQPLDIPEKASVKFAFMMENQDSKLKQESPLTGHL